jgi:glycosyltransferase involved in cell wall biosynthesis
MIEIVGLHPEPIDPSRRWQPRSAGIYRALDQDSEFDVLAVRSPELALPLTRLIQLAYFRPSKDRWIARAGLSSFAFRARTRKAQRLLTRLGRSYDLVFQVGCTYAPRSRPRDRPYVLYLDCTLLLTHRHWPRAAAHGPRAVRGWVGLERAAYERAHHIFTASDWARASLVDDYGIDPARVTTTGIGTNLVRAPAAAPDDGGRAPIVLFVGHEFARKGGMTLLDAWPSVVKRVPGAQAWIVGPPVPSSAPRQPEDGVRWYGRLDGDSLDDVYRRACVFVLPSLHDMSPFVLQEALARGLPCVTTTVGGIPEIVRDGVDSFLIEPGSAAELSERLVELINDPARASRMGDAGRERVLRDCTWQRVVERMAPGLRSAATR